MSPAVIARSQKQPPYQPVPSRIDSAPAEDSPHVCAESFSVYYRAFCAVTGVNLAIPRGKVTAIIGPSGCGKSTLLRAINRMNDLIPGCRVEGRLLLEGQNVYDAPIDVTALRQRVGMVFQKPNPFPKSVFDNVAFGPRIHGIRRKAHLADVVERSLRRAALWDEVRDKLHTNGLALSGGQQQRLCIARAIALQPDILLMDEPCSALDPLATARIEELINEIKARLTVVLVTHNMQQAARVSDYTAFMYMGEMVEFSTTDNIFTRPQQPRTQDYVTGRFG